MADDLDKQTMAKAYARWAPVYDLVFGAVFERGRMASIAAAEQACGSSGRLGWLASTIPSRCCARRRRASSSTGSTMSRRWR
jgi:hypothetical protein